MFCYSRIKINNKNKLKWKIHKVIQIHQIGIKLAEREGIIDSNKQ